MRLRGALATSTLLFLFACDAGGPTDGGGHVVGELVRDASVDAARDGSTKDGSKDASSQDAAGTGIDASSEAGVDASSDAAVDASPSDAAIPDAGATSCRTSFDCKSAADSYCPPQGGTCDPGPLECVGDDAFEPDDGPAAARTIAFPTASAPTTAAGKICSTPATETDWFRVQAPANTDFRASAAWGPQEVDIDIRIYDANGALLDEGISSALGTEAILAPVGPAGDYYVVVVQDSPTTTATTPYTLALTIPNCHNSFDCPASAAFCDEDVCEPGPNVCIGDDAHEPDDGPSLATTLSPPPNGTATFLASTCVEDNESDWVRVSTSTVGEGLTFTLVPSDGTLHSLEVYDATGALLGASEHATPAVVTLTYLPIGTYYASIEGAAEYTNIATPYVLTVERTAAHACSTASDCAATYSTQQYRGACSGGACVSIVGGYALPVGAACDSNTDCLSNYCSYAEYASNAQTSRCTTACTSDADCAALGTGYRCSADRSPNVCVPTCTMDTDCGADTRGLTPDPGRPWRYYLCLAGVCD